MEKGIIILLNGVSSSGKTTLSKAIQDTMQEPYFLMGNDLFFEMLPDRFCQADWMEAEYQALHMMGRTARLFSDAGKHVIIDAVLLSVQKNDPYAAIQNALAGCPVCLVHVVCPAEVLRRRERERKDRDIGQAEGQLSLLYPKDGYDLIIDTHSNTPQECAAQICQWVMSRYPHKII